MNIETTTAGRSYDYNLPKQYNSTGTTSQSCYKKLDTYGACKIGQIVPPTPVSMLPKIFECMKPHNFKPGMSNKYTPSNCEFVGNRKYNNGNGGGQYGSQGGNANTQDTYRKISMPYNTPCGGMGCQWAG